MPHDPDEIEALNELDALLNDRDDALEARFRELEREHDLNRMRRGGDASRGGDAGRRERARAADEDPLADLKARMDGGGGARPSGEVERVVLALCPRCGAKNRIPYARVATGEPRCGACKAELIHDRPKR